MKLELIVDGEVVHAQSHFEMDIEDQIKEYGKLGYGLSKHSWEVYLIVPSLINQMVKFIPPNRESVKFPFDIEHAYLLKDRGWTIARIAAKFRKPHHWIKNKLKEYEKTIDL